MEQVNQGSEIDISVIIPCRNEKHHIQKFLDSILSQAGIDGEFEIIIADGMSDDGTREMLEEISNHNPQILLIDNPAKIVSAGLNAAIQKARGRFIVRMDVHSEYADNYIANCIKALRETGADNVGGPARTRANTYFQTANALAYQSPFSVGGARFHDPKFEGFVDTVTYGCWEKKAFEIFGLFDEELVRNQDDEHNLRITRKEGRIWQTPKIISWYYPRSSLAALFKQYMQYGYWKVRVIQKHHVPASIRHLVPAGYIFIMAILALVSPFVYPAKWAFCFLLLCYVAANFAASLLTCRKSEHWKYLPVMPPVFAAYHFGYGIGFVYGLIDFIILKKNENHKFSTLTRSQNHDR